MKFNENDLLVLADSLKSTLEMHEIEKEIQDSLLSAILFHVAEMIDEKQGSSLHESVFDTLEGYSSPCKDYLVCELGIKTGRKELETNVLHSHIERPEGLQLNIEVLLGLRDISELMDTIDIDARFAKVKITELNFKAMDGVKESYTEEFDNMHELVSFIVRIARKFG